MTATRDPRSFLPLTVPVFHILMALADGERHGYAMLREIEQRTGGELRVGTGTLYAAIGRMVRSGLIAESATRPDPVLDDQRRRYYRLTPLGREVARAEVQRMEKAVGLARHKRLLVARSE